MNIRVASSLFLNVLAGPLVAAPAVPPWGLDLAILDRGTRPGEDFFRHANGGWLKSAHIPADRQIAGINLELDQRNEQRLKALVEELAAAPDSALTDEARRLRDLYLSFVDTDRLEARGLDPLQPELQAIAALHTLDDVAAFMGRPDFGGSGPFALGIEIDEKEPGRYAVDLSQSGLGMPDRDYYLRKDKDSVSTRKAYRVHAARMLAEIGIGDARRGDAVVELEGRIAALHWPADQRREADKTYHRMSVSELERFAPGFPWQAYIAATGVPLTGPDGERQVVVREKSAFPDLARLFASTPVAVWQDYLRLHGLHARAQDLPTRIESIDFEFHGKVIGGQEEPLPRALRGIELVDTRMPDALGKLYVARHFSPAAKARIRTLVENLLRACESSIRDSDWMGDGTREKALEKVRHFNVKVGYPDHWREYDGLVVDSGTLFENVIRADVFEWKRRLGRLDGPVDRSEWSMSAPTNNAYYDSSLNEIVFPAGILQTPYFDPEADDAVNYGSIGATIGHEISHGFDDQGSKYDAEGRLANWWTTKDRRSFESRAKKLGAQFSQYTALPGLHVNGKLTMGENIADLAGLVVARKAYRLSLGGKPAPVLEGFTGEQRFYLAYSQSWREIWTEGLTRRLMLSNPHSPSAFRVNGIVRNDDGWYEAFPDVKPGDRYYLPPGERVRIW